MIKSIVELNGIPLWFFCFVILLAIACGLSTKKWISSLLISYVLIILGETLLFRSPEKSGIQLTLFWSYEFSDLKAQIVSNILLFIPFGFLAGNLWGWKAMLLAAFFSFCIESTQLLFRLGLFEIDDIFHNTSGSIVGYLPMLMCRKIKRQKQCII